MLQSGDLNAGSAVSSLISAISLAERKRPLMNGSFSFFFPKLKFSTKHPFKHPFETAALVKKR